MIGPSMGKVLLAALSIDVSHDATGFTVSRGRSGHDAYGFGLEVAYTARDDWHRLAAVRAIGRLRIAAWTPRTMLPACPRCDWPSGSNTDECATCAGQGAP